MRFVLLATTHRHHCRHISSLVSPFIRFSSRFPRIYSQSCNYYHSTQPRMSPANTNTPTKPIYLGAIDQGTTSTRFIVFNADGGSIVESHQVEYEQIYPKPGWCEHDPMKILQSVDVCIEECCRKLKQRGIEPTEIRAVGITNQRETTVVWDKNTGKPLHNAIVWLDTRTSSLVTQLTRKTHTRRRDHFRARCGLPLSTYFSALKLRWLLDEVEQVSTAAKEKRMLFGTVDSWLIYNLTGGIHGGIHVTDVTNASRTMLMNLRSCEWDPILCDFFDIDKNCLPTIHPSAYSYGRIASGPLKGTPLTACIADQQAAMVGQQCFHPGDVKNTYGTGCFMLFNTGTKPVISKNGLLTTVGYKLGDAKTVYALEGSIAIAGAAVNWLRDNMNMIQSSSQIEELSKQVPDTAGVYFVPAFSGLFAPHWREDARGTIVGLTQYTTRAHLCRATLEAVCFQTREILDAMNADTVSLQTVPLRKLKVDGGMTSNETCMQIQADTLGMEVVRPRMKESTALGAALAAGIGCGVWNDLKEFVLKDGYDTFIPTIDDKEREIRYRDWKRAVERSVGWVPPKSRSSHL